MLAEMYQGTKESSQLLYISWGGREGDDYTEQKGSDGILQPFVF